MAEEESLITTAQRRAFSTSTSQFSPLDNDDLLTEILLRLAPRHSLPRAALVCRRWRRIVAEPAFLRRFRAGTPAPPLLGFFTDNCGELVFTPVVQQRPGGRHHGRAPAARFSPPGSAGASSAAATGLRPRLRRRGAVRGGDCRFSLVLVRANNDCTRASACLYESELGTWGSVISTAITSMVRPVTPSPSVMVGNAFYWLLWPTVLEFDMDSQSLAAIQRPEACATGGITTSFAISRT
ncbi:uncharacterized protein LOC112881001 [Panicum hallii]|uniref:uncharacterized protein LOC112881001 n=1 Tax=Panicum hallii TaxID=206008 RepID=UPI000DF4DEBA|nr:uncharacterized protein LOC112881001 [Panicum hallii]